MVQVGYHLAGSYHQGTQSVAELNQVGSQSAGAVESLHHLGSQWAVVADVTADLESLLAAGLYLPEEIPAVETVVVAVGD